MAPFHSRAKAWRLLEGYIATAFLTVLYYKYYFVSGCRGLVARISCLFAVSKHYGCLRGNFLSISCQDGVAGCGPSPARERIRGFLQALAFRLGLSLGLLLATSLPPCATKSASGVQPAGTRPYGLVLLYKRIPSGLLGFCSLPSDLPARHEHGPFAWSHRTSTPLNLHVLSPIPLSQQWP